MMNRFAVIDLETTGVGNLDTILEIGIVLVDGNEIVLEWETLVNPDRDVANTHIHGVNPGMFSTAPVFEEIQNDIAKLLDGRILVAHNLPFDRRMLNQQITRFRNDFELGAGFCTYKATRLSLNDACQKFGINNSQSHRAITDARVAALLLNATFQNDQTFSPVSISYDDSIPMSRTLARGAFAEEDRINSSKIRRIARSTSMPQISDAEMSYLDALSSGLSDLHLSEMEIAHLDEWAAFLGLTRDQRQKAHQSYFDSFLIAAERDGIITTEEKRLIDQLGLILEVDHEPILVSPQADSTVFSAGIRVCFTGSAKDSSGEDLLRGNLEALATSKGLIPVESVSKSGCDVLIAADKNSMSGKAKKAKGWGMPVLSVQEFLDWAN